MSISFIRISKTPRIQLKDYITRVAKRDVEISDEEKKFIDNYEIKSNILFEKQDYLELTKLSFSLRDKYPNDIKINQFVIGLTVYMINELTDKKVQTDIVELFL